MIQRNDLEQSVWHKSTSKDSKLWLLEDWSVNRFHIFLFSIFILNKRFSFFVADNLEIHIYIKTLMYYREKKPMNMEPLMISLWIRAGFDGKISIFWIWFIHSRNLKHLRELDPQMLTKWKLSMVRFWYCISNFSQLIVRIFHVIFYTYNTQFFLNCTLYKKWCIITYNFI